MKTGTQPRSASAALGCAFVVLALHVLVPRPLCAQAVAQVPPPPPTAAVAAPPAPADSGAAAPLQPVAPAPDVGVMAASESVPTPNKLPSYVLWGVGGASLVGGALVGVTALSAKGAFNDNPTFAAADRVEGRASATDILLGLGLVLVTTGTVFYFTAGEAADEKHAGLPDAGRASLQLAPMIGPKAGGAVAALRF